MSSDGSVELVFAGDTRKFRLGIAELIALQDRRNCGPLEIVSRLQLGTWRVEDIIEPLRIGLIGAIDKPSPDQAKAMRELVEQTVRPPNVIEHALTAMAVLMAALQGVPDDPVGKAARRKSRGRTSASPPRASTATAR